MAVKQLENGRWQVDLTVNGKRKKKNFGSEDEALAFQANAKTMMKQGITPKSDRAHFGVTVGDLYDETCKTDWRAADSVPKRCANVIFSRGYLSRDMPATQVDNEVIAKMIERETEMGAADGTINRKLSAVKKMYTVGQRQGMIPPDVGPKISLIKEHNGRIRYLTDDEESALLALSAQLDEEMYCFIVALIDTGMRTGEALGIRLRDINETVEGWQVTVLGKGSKVRTIPLTDRAQGALIRAAELIEATLPNQRVFALTQSGYRHRWDQLRSAQGYTDDPDYVPHMLRHTCATRLVQRGVDLRIVKEWMGHSTITTTMRYAHLATGLLANARDLLQARPKPQPKLQEVK